MDHNANAQDTSTAVDARITRTKGVLFAALLALLEERPFDQLTIREITKRAGIGYATFFRHYPAKEMLLNDLAADQISTLLNKTLPILYANDTRRSCLVLALYVAEHRALWAALLTGGAAGIVRQEFIRQAKQVAEQQPRESIGLPTELTVVHAVSATVEILSWWLQQGPDFSPEMIAKAFDRLVVAPIMSAEPSVA